MTLSAEKKESLIRNAVEMAREFWQKEKAKLIATADNYDKMTAEERAAHHADPPPGPNGEQFVNLNPTGAGMRGVARAFGEQEELFTQLLADIEAAEVRARCVVCGRRD